MSGVSEFADLAEEISYVAVRGGDAVLLMPEMQSVLTFISAVRSNHGDAYDHLLMSSVLAWVLDGGR